MKLLDKKVIVQQKAQERKLEIDEGVKLATKIDTLRKTYSEEEKKLSDFRRESLKGIKSELDEIVSQIKTKKQDLLVLEKQSTELRKPLDIEWQTLHKEKLELEKKQELLTRQISEFLENERLQNKRKEELDLDESRLEDLKKTTNQTFEDARSEKLQADWILHMATVESTKLIGQANARLEDSVSREMKVASEERDIINQKKILDQREEALDKKERAINDKYQTLLRTINRTKNG